MAVGVGMRSWCAAGIAAVLTSVCGMAQAQTNQPLYVVSQDPGTGASALLALPTTGPQAFTVTQSLPLAGTPDAIGVAGSGTVAFVRDQTANSVSAIALTGTAAGTLLGATTGLATPNGYSVAGSTDTLYIANGTAGTVSVVPTRGPSAGSVIATISGFSTPREVAALTNFSASGSTDRVFVANFTAGTVSLVTSSGGAATGITATIPVGTGPWELTNSGGSLYVANNGSDSISVIDKALLTVTQTITGVSQPRAMFVSSTAGPTLYAVASGSNQVAVIPLSGSAAYTVASTIPVGQGPTQARMSTDGSEAYILNTTDNSISVLSLATNSVTRTLTGLGAIKALSLGAAPTTIVGAVLPGSRSVQQGTSATVFATMINAGAIPLAACRINLPTGQRAPLSITTTETDPTTNEPDGTPPNQPVVMLPGGTQTFVLSFLASAVTAMATQPLQFFCEGMAPATVIPGVNTVDLAFGATATADVIALAATASNDGIVRVPLSSNGAGAFAVASANVGVAGALTVTADTGGVSLPISLSLCQTNPANGQCLAPPAASVPTTIAAGATPTFSIFVSASAGVAAAPGTNRVFVRFLDAGGTSHGATSVAVQTD